LSDYGSAPPCRGCSYRFCKTHASSLQITNFRLLFAFGDRFAAAYCGVLDNGTSARRVYSDGGLIPPQISFIGFFE
jgi:hypothetical protein